MGVSYDSVAVLKKFSRSSKVEFPLLADSDSKAIDAFKVRNKAVGAGSRLDGVALPVTILVDSKGVIRAKLPGTVRKRHSVADLVKAAKSVK